MVSKAIGTAQTKVEAFHFEMRKHLVEYDEVINQHRRIVYEDRRRILLGEDLRLKVLSLIEREIQPPPRNLPHRQRPRGLGPRTPRQ